MRVLKLVYCYKLGNEFTWAINYAFWWYSGFLDDLLNEDRMKDFLGENSTTFAGTLVMLENLVQSLRIWLEKKLLQLESELRDKNYKNIKDFENAIQDQETSKIISDVAGLYKIYVEEEKRREKGEKWGQGIIDYIDSHP